MLYPQLSDPDRPSVHNWLELLDSELAQLGDGERVVIAHSLAVPLWLHAVSREPGVAQTDRVLLVSPPSPPYCPEGVEAAYPDLRLDTTIVPGGGHLDRDSGYGPWPSILACCRDSAARIEPNWPSHVSMPIPDRRRRDGDDVA